MHKRSFSSFKKRRGSKFKKIDYKNKEFKNPFFQNKKRSFSKPDLISTLSLVKSRLTIIIFSAIMIIVIYFAFFSNIFEIQNININGLARTSHEKIAELIDEQRNQKRFLFLNQNNLLIFNKTKLVKNIEANYDFAKVEIKKDFRSTLNIDIQEKSLALIWLENEKYYNADNDGYIISEVGALDVKKDIYPIIENQRQIYIKDNKIDFNKNEINYALELFSNFIESAPDIKIEKFILDNESNTIKVKVSGGPEIYFNTKEDANKQLNKLITLKNERLKDNFSEKTYINLKYGDRIYYR